MQTGDDSSKAAGSLTERQQRIFEFVQAFQGERGYPPSIREIGEHFAIRSTNGVSDHLRALERKGFLMRSGNLSRSLTVVRDPGHPPRELQAAAREVQATAREVQLVREDPAEPAFATDDVEYHRDHRLPSNVRTLPQPAQRQGGLHARRPAGTPALVRRDQPSARDQSALVPVLGKVAAGLPLLAVEQAEETLAVDEFLLGGGSGEVFALRVVGESMIEAGILPGDLLFVRRRQTVRSGEIAVVLLGGEATVKRWIVEGDAIRLQPENRTMAPMYVRPGDASQCQVAGVVVGVYRKL